MTPHAANASLAPALPDIAMSAEAEVDVTLRSDADPGLRLTAFLFQQLFQDRATLVSAAAGGLTLFGGPDDRSALAIPLRWGATVAAAARADGLVELRSISHAGKELTCPVGDLAEVPDWAARSVAAVSVMTAGGDALGGLSLLVGTSLPEGAGMQADVALTSVVGSALAGLFGVELSLAQRAALGDLPAQLASMSCPDGMALLVDTQRMTAEAVPFDLVAAGLRLMIIDVGGPAANVPSVPGDLAVAAADLLRAGDLPGLGALLSQTGGDDGEPDPDVALVMAAAVAAGALGSGRLAGGCLAALVPVDLLGPVRSAVAAAWPGERSPRFLTAVSSRGGH